jgi:hypothetical protein
LLPIGRQLKWIKSTCSTDDDVLRTAQENAQAFFFYRCVESADDGAIFCAPTLREINRFNDFVARACFRAEYCVQLLLQDLRVAMRPEFLVFAT